MKRHETMLIVFALIVIYHVSCFCRAVLRNESMYFQPKDHGCLELIFTLDAYGSVDFESIIIWRHDNLEDVALGLMPYLDMQDDDSLITLISTLRTNAIPLGYSEESADFDSADQIVASVLKRYNPLIQLSRYQLVAWISEVMRLSMLNEVDLPVDVIFYHCDHACRSAWVDIFAATKGRLDVEYIFFDEIASNDESRLNRRTMWFVYNPCKPEDFGLCRKYQTFVNAWNIIMLPNVLILHGFPNTYDRPSRRVLQRAYSWEFNMLAHIGEKYQMVFFCERNSDVIVNGQIQHSLLDVNVYSSNLNNPAEGSISVPIWIPNRQSHWCYRTWYSNVSTVTSSAVKKPVQYRQPQNSSLCAYYGRIAYANHFPHWATQIFFAWSLILWADFYQVPPLRVIFDRTGSLGSKKWISGMREAIGSHWSGTFFHDWSQADILELTEKESWCLLESHSTGAEAWESSFTWFLHPADARLLRSVVIKIDPCTWISQVSFVAAKTMVESIQDLDSVAVGNRSSLLPEFENLKRKLLWNYLLQHCHFTIVDRRGSRGIINKQAFVDMVYQIANEIGFDQSISMTNEFMENKTFSEQVHIFNSTDVLIIAHGAALTNMLFLPPCAIVLEIMPWGYIIPGMFGSLAKDMNLVYRYTTPTSRPLELGDRCPEAVEADCRIGDHNMTVSSFQCRNCIRKYGVVSIRLDTTARILADAAYDRAKCLMLEGKLNF